MGGHRPSQHSYFWGERGHFELTGAFKPEPNWQRLAKTEDGRFLQEVRCCHEPNYAYSRMDWSELGGMVVFVPAVVDPDVGTAGSPPASVATSPEVYDLNGAGAGAMRLLETFVKLPLDREAVLLDFVRQWGLPTMLRRPAVTHPEAPGFDISPCCPVLRLQYDVAVLRNLMRLASELSRPEPDRHSVTRLTKVLQAMWQDPLDAWPAVGGEGDSEHPDPPDWWPLCGETEFPPYELEVMPPTPERQRGSRRPAHVMRGTNAVKVGFARALANCSPSVGVRYTRGTGYRLGPRFLFRCEATRLRDFIYLQAWESLADKWLGECACGCKSLFMLTSQQRRAFLENRKVFLPNHRYRARRRSLQSAEEADRQRTAWRERKARQRKAARERDIAEGRPQRRRGRPRKGS